jgi:two-component system chemotaxis response regulator CheY
MEMNRACVMVVDDQAVMRILILGSLRKLGVQQLHAFADGASALAALASTRPDLILTDVQMQPMDGVSLVRAIRTLPDPELAATRIVFLSGDDSDGTRHQAEALDVRGFVAKPPTPAMLAGMLERVLAC